MPMRVIQWGAGNTGSHSLRFLMQDPAYEVVGVWVGRQQNVGKTAGELAGLPPSGVRATNDAESLVRADADCVVYMAAEPRSSLTKEGSDGWRSLDMICRLLASGKNVVCTGISGLIYPGTYGDDVRRRLENAAIDGDSTFFGTGIEPGFMCDALALSLTSISRDVEFVGAQEMISYATYDQPNYHVSHGGIWGAPLDERYAQGFGARVLAAGMGAPVLLLAEALNVQLDDLKSSAEFASLGFDFEIPMGSIAAGTIAGYRFRLTGIKNGVELIAVEHITRLHEAVAPDWPSLDPGGFRVTVRGKPSFTTTVIFDEDDANIAACTGTAARAVNAVGVVCAAPRGVCSFLDLPGISAKGSIA